MILTKISEMAGMPSQKFKCSMCRNAAADLMWMDLGVEAKSGRGEYAERPKLMRGELYLCKGCAVDLCLGLLRDVAEIEEGNGNKRPFEALEELDQVFSRV